MNDNVATSTEETAVFSEETINVLNNVSESLQLLIGDFVMQMNLIIEDHAEDDDPNLLQRSLKLLYQHRLPTLLAWMPSKIIAEFRKAQPEALSYVDELSLEDSPLDWSKTLTTWLAELLNLRFLRLKSDRSVDISKLTGAMSRLETTKLLPKLVKIAFSDQELVNAKQQLRETKRQELLQARATGSETLQLAISVDEFTVANSSVAGDTTVQQLIGILTALAAKQHTLDKLDISELNFNNAAFVELSKLLATLQLEELSVDLSSTAFHEADVIQLPETVRTLIITQATTEVDSKLLKSILQSCPELETLTIRGNPDVELEALLRAIHPLCPQAIIRSESKFGITGILPETVTVETAVAREQHKSKILEKLPFDDFDGDIPTNYQSWQRIDTRKPPQLSKQATEFLSAIQSEA